MEEGGSTSRGYTERGRGRSWEDVKVIVYNIGYRLTSRRPSCISGARWIGWRYDGVCLFLCNIVDIVVAE